MLTIMLNELIEFWNVSTFITYFVLWLFLCTLLFVCGAMNIAHLYIRVENYFNNNKSINQKNIKSKERVSVFIKRVYYFLAVFYILSLKYRTFVLIHNITNVLMINQFNIWLVNSYILIVTLIISCIISFIVIKSKKESTGQWNKISILVFIYLLLTLLIFIMVRVFDIKEWKYESINNVINIGIYIEYISFLSLKYNPHFYKYINNIINKKLFGIYICNVIEGGNLEAKSYNVKENAEIKDIKLNPNTKDVPSIYNFLDLSYKDKIYPFPLPPNSYTDITPEIDSIKNCDFPLVVKNNDVDLYFYNDPLRGWRRKFIPSSHFILWKYKFPKIILINPEIITSENLQERVNAIHNRVKKIIEDMNSSQERMNETRKYIKKVEEGIKRLERKINYVQINMGVRTDIWNSGENLRKSKIDLVQKKSIDDLERDLHKGITFVVSDEQWNLIKKDWNSGNITNQDNLKKETESPNTKIKKVMFSNVKLIHSYENKEAFYNDEVSTINK